MAKKAKLTPLMIARLFGVQVRDGSKWKKSIEDSGNEVSVVSHPVGYPPAEMEKEYTGVKGSATMPSITIGLVIIGMMMVAVGALLFLPINLSLEHARIIGGLGFFVVGVSVIFSSTSRAR
jgi:hypothetical protein